MGQHDFEWDEDKNKTNQQKHKLAFDDAPAVFENPTVNFRDNRFDYGEERYVALGILQGIVVVVAYTYRGEKIRIISMRKATAAERRKYAEECK